MDNINNNLNNFINIFNMNNINNVLSIFLKITIPLFIAYLIIFTICLYKIFEKENIKPIYCLIPVYRFYLYYKIIKLPFILYFVPGINLIMFLLSPYKLADQYKCNDFIKAISIFIPFIIVPYIAFSDLQNREKKIETKYIRNEQDLDELERKLTSSVDGEFIDDDTKTINIQTNNYESKTDTFLDSLTYDNQNDEYVEDEEFKKEEEVKVEELPEEKIDEFEDVTDEDNIDGFNMANIDSIEEKVMNNFEKGSTTEIQDVEEEKKEELDVAFGGSEQKAKVKVQSRKENVCPKCGADLTGATESCPGCGTKLSDL